MAAPAKLAQVWGFLAKEEASYNAGDTTLSNSADGILPFLDDDTEPPAPEPIEYVYDGALGRAPGNLVSQLRTTPNGRFRRLSIPVRFKGAGTAYASSAVTPPLEVHRLLKAAGFTATFDTDHWDYTPTAAGTGFTSLAIADYRHAEAFRMDGVIANWSYTADDLGPPLHTFECVGVAGLPTEASLPTITYGYAAVIPPVAAGITINIGDFAAPVVRRISYNNNRSVDNPRARQSAAGGHLGFIPSGARPTWEVEIEKTAFVASPFHTTGGLVPETLRANATSVPFAVRFGGTSTNRWTHGSGQVQVINVQHGNDGSVATVTLTLQAHGSTPSANDAEYLLFD